MSTIAPVPASLSCRECHQRNFHAQLAESGNYLVLVCTNCTLPILFGVQTLNDFPNPKQLIIEADALVAMHRTDF